MEEAAEVVRHPVTKPCTMNTHSQHPLPPSAPPTDGHQARRGQQGPLTDAASRTSCTPLTGLPPTPERTSAEQRGTCSRAASPETTPRRGRCRAPKERRRPPRRGHAAQRPPIYNTRSRIWGFPTLPLPERPAEGEESHRCAGGRCRSRSRPRVFS
jgi:hypothetical protein